MNDRRGLAIAGITLIFAAAALVQRPALAGGRMIIAPTRIILEEGAHSAIVHVGNNGDLPIALRISIVDKRMLESGPHRQRHRARARRGIRRPPDPVSRLGGW